MNLASAIERFRAIGEATTSAMVAPTHTTAGSPFFGKEGLRRVEKERQQRIKAQKKSCKGYDPKCRDKEWEVPASTGGVTGVGILRRTGVGGR